MLLAVLTAGQQTPPPAKQPPATPPQGDQPTHISVEVTRVSMAFSVTDRKGRFVTGLGKDDFEVLENGRRQSIAEFTAEPTLPLRVAVLIDTSNSIRDRFKFEQEAASQFLDEILRSSQDKAMVVSFDSNVQIACDLTADTDKLSRAIHDLRPGGGTAMYDGIRLAAEKLGAGAAELSVPPHHRDRQRRRGQSEPRHARPGAGIGANGRHSDVRDLHQQSEFGRHRRRQSAALLHHRNGRQGRTFRSSWKTWRRHSKSSPKKSATSTTSPTGLTRW